MTKSSGKCRSVNYALFIMLAFHLCVKNICFLQVHLWTFEEEASYSGYSSATVSEGCRSNHCLEGGVCVHMCVYIYFCKSSHVRKQQKLYQLFPPLPPFGTTLFICRLVLDRHCIVSFQSLFTEKELLVALTNIHFG